MRRQVKKLSYVRKSTQRIMAFILCGRTVEFGLKTRIERKNLEQALFHFFLAGETVTGPGYVFQALLLELLMAGDSFAEAIIFDASQGVIHQLKQRTVVMRLTEEKFFGVGVCSLVREVHGWVFIGFAAFLFGARDSTHEFVAPSDQFLFVIFEPLLVHS